MGVDTAASDRLPWLPDEPARAPLMRRPLPAGTAFAAALVVIAAIAASWIGVWSVERAAVPQLASTRTTMTVHLPPPHPAPPPQVAMPHIRDVQPAQAPDVRPVPARNVRIADPPHPKALKHQRSKPERKESVNVAPSRAPADPSHALRPASGARRASADAYVGPRPANPRMLAGAAGRVVEIGAFGSVRQAKRGWWFMVRAYPAMAHLPAVVRPTRNSKGRVFFRFQVGTTSQAHSEVLCQRMVRIDLSCAVVGLPGRARVER
jgi:hypothetical protein